MVHLCLWNFIIGSSFLVLFNRNVQVGRSIFYLSENVVEFSLVLPFCLSPPDVVHSKA
jgi:hypothetical protein